MNTKRIDLISDLDLDTSDEAVTKRVQLLQSIAEEMALEWDLDEIAYMKYTNNVHKILFNYIDGYILFYEAVENIFKLARRMAII